MSRRERVLLILGPVVIVTFVFFYYVYQPKQAEYQRLTQELRNRRGQLERMEATARLVPQLEREYAELRSFIASVEAKLPSQKDIPALLVQLERLTTSLKIDLLAIKPGTLAAVTEASTQAPAGKPPQPAAGAPAYFKFPIKLTVTTSYGEFLRLTSGLHDFPRLMVVRRITVTPKAVPDLTADLDVETFVLPKEAR